MHEGNGAAQIIIDDSADAAQRDALVKIMSGQEQEPGATVFSVFASTFTTVYDPIFTHIDLEIDIEARRGTIHVAGLIEAQGEPLKNPITGNEHRARIDLPNGFESRTKVTPWR